MKWNLWIVFRLFDRIWIIFEDFQNKINYLVQIRSKDIFMDWIKSIKQLSL